MTDVNMQKKERERERERERESERERENVIGNMCKEVHNGGKPTSHTMCANKCIMAENQPVTQCVQISA